jgi:hypothetical protein
MPTRLSFESSRWVALEAWSRATRGTLPLLQYGSHWRRRVAAVAVVAAAVVSVRVTVSVVGAQ